MVRVNSPTHQVLRTFMGQELGNSFRFLSNGADLEGRTSNHSPDFCLTHIDTFRLVI